jgi:hypothetical protein
MRTMLKSLLLVLGVLAVATPALAHDHGWKHKRHHHHFIESDRFYYVERPVVVVPARPRYVEPRYVEPMYYGPPPPPSINFNIPLR